MLTLATSALAGGFKKGMKLASYAADNPRKALALGVGLGTAGVLALNTKSIYQSLSGSKTNTMDTSADSSYFTAPSDAINAGMYLYGENPITALGIGFGANIALEKFGGPQGLRNYMKKLAAADKAAGVMLDPKLYGEFMTEMGRVKSAASPPGGGTLSKIWRGIKGVARATRPDSDAIKAAEKYLERNPFLKGTETGRKLASRIGFISKAKALNNIASFGWAASMAYDVGKSFFTGSMPAFNVPTIRTTSLGGTFNDSSEAYTQRRRAIEAMHNSQYSGRSAFGNEASLMHA